MNNYIYFNMNTKSFYTSKESLLDQFNNGVVCMIILDYDKGRNLFAAKDVVFTEKEAIKLCRKYTKIYRD